MQIDPTTTELNARISELEALAEDRKSKLVEMAIMASERGATAAAMELRWGNCLDALNGARTLSQMLVSALENAHAGLGVVGHPHAAEVREFIETVLADSRVAAIRTIKDTAQPNTEETV